MKRNKATVKLPKVVHVVARVRTVKLPKVVHVVARVRTVTPAER
jgi:hypothetical protein